MKNNCLSDIVMFLLLCMCCSSVSADNGVSGVATKSGLDATKKKIAFVRGVLELEDGGHIPEYGVHYNGSQALAFSRSGFFSFDLIDEKPDMPGFVIAESVFPVFEKKNTVMNLRLDPAKSYKYFVYDGQQDTWSQQKLALDDTKKSRHVPENTIVVLGDPSLVVSVQSLPAKLRAQCTMPGPCVVFKNDVVRHQSASRRSMSASLDLAQLFEVNQAADHVHHK